MKRNPESRGHNQFEQPEWAELYDFAMRAVKRQLPPDRRHEADDIVQDSMLRLLNALGNQQFRGDSALKTYFYTILRNRACSQAVGTAKRRIKETPIEDFNGPSADDFTDMVGEPSLDELIAEFTADSSDPEADAIILEGMAHAVPDTEVHPKLVEHLNRKKLVAAGAAAVAGASAATLAVKAVKTRRSRLAQRIRESRSAEE